MNIKSPHIIQEGGVAYEIGKIYGKEIRYDFKKM